MNAALPPLWFGRLTWNNVLIVEVRASIVIVNAALAAGAALVDTLAPHPADVITYELRRA